MNFKHHLGKKYETEISILFNKNFSFIISCDKNTEINMTMANSAMSYQDPLVRSQTR